MRSVLGMGKPFEIYAKPKCLLSFVPLFLIVFDSNLKKILPKKRLVPKSLAFAPHVSSFFCYVLV